MTVKEAGTIEMTRTRARTKRLVARLMIAIPPLRRVLNERYLKLGYNEQFHNLYDGLFRNRLAQRLMPSGQWTVRFMDRDIVMPLNSKLLWLHWDLAVSINSVDIEVKQTYSTMLSSDAPPTLFLDIGANYGTHSILFSSVGIPVIAFEPNPTCFEFCEMVCQLNGFSCPQWEQVAIGDRSGQVDLSYPEGYAWLGSISPAAVRTTSDFFSRRRNVRNLKVIRHVVRLRPLDDYLSQTVGKRLLIKIDAEGLELEVLRGASRILTHVRPHIIFETNDPASRLQLHGLLTDHNYSVHALPWLGTDAQSLAMPAELFVQSKAINFFAKPCG